MDSLSTLLFALAGFFCGVVVNRAADNLPPPERGSLLAAPRCRYCGTAREPWEQSGLIDVLLLRGKCPHCRAPLPWRAPLVELMLSVLFAYLWLRFGPGLPVLAYALFTTVLLLITVIDLEHRLILNVIVLPATVIALILLPAVTQAPATFDKLIRAVLMSRFLGAVTGYLIVFLIYLFGLLFARWTSHVRRQTVEEVAFGMGDVKLAGLVGAVVGFPLIAPALVYTILLGGAGSLAAVLYQVIRHRRYSAMMAIPYGPFFTLAAWFVMLRGA